MKDDKRQDYLSKEDMFMLMARIVAKRSKDPHTQVGAVIVGDNDRILSLGYNGFPNGCSDDEFPWTSEPDESGMTKYDSVCHSECNAILNYRGNTADLKGATLYVTLFPCNECAKLIIQAGIKNVIYLSDKYSGTHSNTVAKRLFKAAGVNCFKFTTDPKDAYKVINDVSAVVREDAELVGPVGTVVNSIYDKIIDAIR